jgi:integrase
MAAINSIDTPTKRKKLTPRREPYWQKVTQGQYFGFRRTKTGGNWIARLRTPDGKHRYNALDASLPWDDKDTYEQAHDLALEWFGAAGSIDDHHYSVNDAVADYVSHLKVERSAKTAEDTRQRLDKNITDKLGNAELAKLKTITIKQWRDSLVRVSDDPEDVRRSKSGANRVLSMLKAALNLAFYNGQVASDREWRRVKPFRSVDEARKLFLTDKQVKRLLDKTEGSFHALLRGAVLTGARYGELANAKVSNFDPKQAILTLTGKTGTHDAYLSDDALTFFKQQARNKLPGAWLFTKEDGSPWGKNHHTRLMHDAVKAAKLPRDTVFYSLRHYHISKALLAGVPAQVVAENCGTSIRMIEKHYGKFMAQDRRSFFNQVVL